MKIKTQNLIGKALDFTVAKCEGKALSYESEILTVDELDLKHGVAHSMVAFYRPSSNWRQGGLLIEKHNINLVKNSKDQWVAFVKLKRHAMPGLVSDAPLVAAMRCLVWVTLGDEVEVPDELL